MAALIRLKRHGKKKAPYYRIVVTDKRQARDAGSGIEELGTYDPKKEEAGINIDVEKTKSWLAKGVQISARVKRLFKTAGIIG